MIKRYLIAGFLIEIKYDGDSVLTSKLSDYETDSGGAIDIDIEFSRVSDDICVKKENLIKLSDISYFYSEKEKDVLFYYDENIAKVIAKIEFSKDYKNVNSILYNLEKNHNVCDDQLMYNVMGTIMNYSTQMNGGFVFHSSSICYKGYGVAFSAKSGTGKSTHTKLWLNNFDGCYILNDDTPIINQKHDGEFYLCGTPWAGTTGINKNSDVPLKALVFLERGTDNTIEKMLPQKAMQPFFEGIRSPLTDAMFSKVLDTLNKLLTKVPVYNLKCNMDPEAAIVARDEIYKGYYFGSNGFS